MALVIPLSTFYDNGGRLKQYLTEKFYWKVATFCYPQFVYLPHGGGLKFDGFAQLDRLCPVPVSQIVPTHILLKKEARDLLMACLRAFLNQNIFVTEEDQFWGDLISTDLQPQYETVLANSKTSSS